MDNTVLEFHKFQMEAWLSQAKVVALIGGTSGGKTTVASFMMAREAEAVQDKYLLVVPTYKIAEQSTLPCFINLADRLGWGKYSDHKKQFRFARNGSVMYVRSLDHPKLKHRVIEGIPARYIWMDEAGLASKKAFDLAKGRVSFKDGRLILTSKAYEANWLYKDVVQKAGLIMLPDGSQRRKPDGFQDYFAACFPSIANPNFSKETYEIERTRMDDAEFAVMYGGQFVILRGRVWKIIKKIEREKVPCSFDDVVGGVDWGSTNPAALVGLGVKNQIAYAIAEFDQSFLGIDELYEIAYDWKKAYGIRRWYGDPSEPTDIKYFNDRECECEAMDGSSSVAISRVRGRLTSGRLLIADDLPRLSECMEMYHYPEEGGSKPVKKDDHLCNALASAVAGIEVPEAAGETGDADAMYQQQRGDRWQNIIDRKRSFLRR